VSIFCLTIRIPFQSESSSLLSTLLIGRNPQSPLDQYTPTVTHDSTRPKKTGKKKGCRKYVIDFIDNNKIRRRLPAFSNKRESMFAAERIEWLLSCYGWPLDPELTKWLSQIPPKMYEQLVGFELLDVKQVAAGKPLKEHIVDFEKSLLARGRTEEYARLTTARVRRVIEECGFVNWSGISASTGLEKIVALRRYVKVTKVIKVDGKKVRKKELKDIGPISAKTKNYYLQAVRQFCKWMVLDRRVSESPVGHLQSLDTTSDQSNERRPFELHEMRLLLETTQIGPDRFRIRGIERAMIYRVAAETGFRANELRSLKKSSFDFRDCIVTVKVGCTKNSKKAVLPLRKDTAVALQQLLANKMPDVPAFRMPSKYRMADMIRADCEVAGIDCEDNRRGKIDFHSLRHTTGSLLAASGVHPKVAQSIMRHSDINLTMSIYTHTLTGQESQAIDSLPDLSLPSNQRQIAFATGTDDVTLNDLTYTGRIGVRQRISANSNEQKKSDNDSKTAILNTPGRIRTCDLRIRNPLLYPTELRAHQFLSSCFIITCFVFCQ